MGLGFAQWPPFSLDSVVRELVESLCGTEQFGLSIEGLGPALGSWFPDIKKKKSHHHPDLTRALRERERLKRCHVAGCDEGGRGHTLRNAGCSL